jgi:transposase-like protein
MANGATARIKKREALWRRVVAGHGRSGMSVRAYCAKHGVKEPVFYWWRAELARRDAIKPLEAFVPVVVQPTASGQVEGITIELRGGRVLRLPAMPVSQVVELVRVIEGMA